MTRRGLALLMLSLGCGGSTLRADAGRDQGADSPSARECPASVLPGGACLDDSLVCLGDDACNDCFCQSSVWVCTTRMCNHNPPSCPLGRPHTGDACAVARDVCDYGVGCSGAHCVCAGSTWTCDVVNCSDE